MSIDYSKPIDAKQPAKLQQIEYRQPNYLGLISRHEQGRQAAARQHGRVRQGGASP